MRAVWGRDRPVTLPRGRHWLLWLSGVATGMALDLAFGVL